MTMIMMDFNIQTMELNIQQELYAKEREGRRRRKYMKRRKKFSSLARFRAFWYRYFQHLCRLLSRPRVTIRDPKHTPSRELEEKLVIGGMKDGMGFGSITSCYAWRIR